MEQPRRKSKPPIEHLYEERNFDQRIEALELYPLSTRVREALEAVDDRLFQRLQAEIQAGLHQREGFKHLAYQYFDPISGESGYDNLDIFINRLFPFQDVPEPTKDLEPEMVYYQKTPARIVFELAGHLRAGGQVAEGHLGTGDHRETGSPPDVGDVFFDLGSGLGQVVILVHLLTGIPSRGIEFEPAFCAYARDCADWLRLPGVTFLNTDARDADYGEGTVFFLFTPFRGEMLKQVLALLQKEAVTRKIKVMTYGPCTEQVAKEPWLQRQTPPADDTYKLCVFLSI